MVYCVDYDAFLVFESDQTWKIHPQQLFSFVGQGYRVQTIKTDDCKTIDHNLKKIQDGAR